MKETASATVTFARSGWKNPQLDEDLVTYSGDASTAFSKVSAAMSACKKVHGGVPGLPTTGTVSELTFPRFGDQSVAYKAKLSVALVHSSSGEDLLIDRQGSLIMEIFEVNAPGSVSISQFEHFVTLAVAKIRS